MKLSRWSGILFSVSAALGLVLVARARASMPHDEYLKMLQIAQGKVDREKAAREEPGALSSSVIKALFGRYYEVGDSWKVAAWYARSNQAAMTSDMSSVDAQRGRAGIFEYTVTQVQTGLSPEIVLEVTQKDEYGIAIPDSRVKFLQLTMNDRMLQSLKAYSITGRPDLVHVSPEGIHSGITLLELFPLDVPEIVTAERQDISSLPELPPALEAVARAAGYHPDLKKSQWFEQDDFFGRPVDILWQNGDPWPAYLKTINGTAILISKNTS